MSLSDFFAEQADYILFFYGMAFILLGITCLAISGHAAHCRSWRILGAFGLVHGASEWLDLLALVTGDNPTFATFRTAVMAGSYVLLLEFGRRELKREHPWLAGGWIYAPLIALVVVGGLSLGLPVANALARYSLGFVGALAACLAFAQLASKLPGAARGLSVTAAIGFAIYGIAAGLVVPTAPIWPADVINQENFLSATGVPIQFFRGLLACLVAVAIWGIWGQKLMLEVSSSRYSRFLRRQFVGTIGVMCAILILGWIVTEYFGLVHKQKLISEMRGSLDLIAASLEGETAPVDAVARSLAGSLELSPATSDGSLSTKVAAPLLALNVAASGALRGYIVSRDGTIIAASSKGENDTHLDDIPAVQHALDGMIGRHFAFNPDTKSTDYYASSPVRRASGSVDAVVVLIRSLADLQHKLETFNAPYFLIDPAGHVALTNRPDLSPSAIEIEQDAGSEQRTSPVGASPTKDAGWATVDGEPMFVDRRPIDKTDWQLLIFIPIEGIYASRVLGIALTLLTTIMVLIYIIARERAVHDHVQMDRRLELEELARVLDHKATTDPLTGLANRLKFDEALSAEIMRSQRHHLALSLILFDIDHFKRVNDNHGHQIGDATLIELSRRIASRMRATDLLARWGGEEFAILLPHSDIDMAATFATILKDTVAGSAFDNVGTLTCSFGVAQLGQEDAKSLLERADQALYRAKLNGRNRVELATLTTSSGYGSAA